MRRQREPIVKALSSRTHATPHTVVLRCHPSTATSAIRSIDVRVMRSEPNVLTLAYRLTGDLARVRLPAGEAEQAPRPLWQHTCCEAFIRRAGVESYHEFNFGTSGAWAAYFFEHYRAGAPLADDALDPRVHVQCSRDTLELQASIHLDRLSASHACSRLALALSAVIEERDGDLTYWALMHPPGKADFHHRDAFALELEARE
jgi:hypothetical protein